MVRLLSIYGFVISVALAVNARRDPAVSAVCFVAGLLLWTLLEYLIHRFAFHGFLPHWQHHELPTDPKYIIAPLWLSGGTSIALWAIFALALGSWARSGLILAGIISGYLGYEAIHIRIHSQAAGGRILRTLRKRHYYHHFANDHFCYGVLTAFWDRVFGSLPAAFSTADRRAVFEPNESRNG